MRLHRLRRLGLVMIAALVTVGVAAPWLAPYDPLRPVAESFGEPFPPQIAHPLGTDELGRDVLSRVLYGARLSLLIAGAATSLTVLLGGMVGLAAGYLGRVADDVLMRLTDVFLAFPALLLAMALSAVAERGLWTMFVVIALVNWTAVARTIRSEVLSLREQDFVQSAQALGGGSWRVMLRHLLPNVMPTLLVMAALSTSTTLLIDAGLSYLGLGVPVPEPSWGRMISDSQSYFRVAPWLIFFPGLAIAYAVCAFNLLGYGLMGTWLERGGEG